jgi:hypothetical protein
MAWKFEYYKPFVLVFFSCNYASGKVGKLKPKFFIDTHTHHQTLSLKLKLGLEKSTERPVLPLAPWLSEDIGHPPFRGKGTSVYYYYYSHGRGSQS